MSPLVTILGVITAIAFAIAPDLVSVNPALARYAMLIGVAAAAAGGALRPSALRRGIPRRGAFARGVNDVLGK